MSHHLSACVENPKALRAAEERKDRLELLEPAALRQLAAVMAHGADKYGVRNYMSNGTLRKSTYFAAILRHTFAWFREGDTDPDSGLPHMAHVMACAMIMLTATVIDDNETPGA